MEIRNVWVCDECILFYVRLRIEFRFKVFGVGEDFDLILKDECKNV